MKTTIEVEINNIKVDEYYYSFNYILKVNNIQKAKGLYESDHSWRGNVKGWEECLREGEAVSLVIQSEL